MLDIFSTDTLFGEFCQKGKGLLRKIFDESNAQNITQEPPVTQCSMPAPSITFEDLTIAQLTNSDSTERARGLNFFSDYLKRAQNGNEARKEIVNGLISKLKNPEDPSSGWAALSLIKTLRSNNSFEDTIIPPYIEYLEGCHNETGLYRATFALPTAVEKFSTSNITNTLIPTLSDLLRTTHDETVEDNITTSMRACYNTITARETAALKDFLPPIPEAV